MIKLFDDIAKDAFLKDYWQQKARLFKQAFTNVDELINGDELAYLACDTQVESRFIFSNDQETQWQVEHGPFAENRFTELPPTNWTLMVQSVDHWLPEVHDILTSFDFLPRWRLDDILATYAVDGGGVGPHFDYYDVFLIQASGQRRWRIGQHCDEDTELQNNNDVKLLKHFAQHDEYVLSPGDILYVPPGTAHWGTAIGDDCITLSVGFRAPSQAELSAALASKTPIATMPENIRYKDSSASIDANPYKINSAVTTQLIELFGSSIEGLASNEDLLSNLLDCFAKDVTTPRNLSIVQAEEEIDSYALIKTAIEFKESIYIDIDAVCRTAFIEKDGSRADLYFNGNKYQVSLSFAEQFCHGDVSYQELMVEAQAALIHEWTAEGLIYISP